MPSSFSMRCISIERLSTPETGLLISCATRGRELAERGQAVALQQLLLRGLELLGALLDLGLQVLRELIDLRRARSAGGRA